MINGILFLFIILVSMFLSEKAVSEAIRKIETYYADKLDFLKTEFTVDAYTDCIVKGNLERVIEVMQNLMENAIKYGDGHKIHITFSEEEGCRLVTVESSGEALPENERPYIFDSFWRGSNVKSQSGSGFGLYICRRLLSKMDGEIFAAFALFGRGSPSRAYKTKAFSILRKSLSQFIPPLSINSCRTLPAMRIISPCAVWAFPEAGTR